MKYTTALTFLLAFGPATSVLAAPLTQGPASALTAGPAPEGQAPPGGRPAPGGPAPSGQAAPGGQPAGSTAGGQTAPAPSGSSSEALNGASMGNEGVLDKVEKILKDLASGLRKRSIIEEVGQAAKLTLDSTSKLLNGESSGSQSSYNTQSTDPDALPSTGSTTGDNQATSATGPTPPTPPAPVSKGSSSGSSSGSGSGSGSQLSKLLSGRSLTDEIDPLNTSGSTAPISSSAGEPSFPGSPAHATKGSNPVGSVAPLDTQKQNTEEDKKEKEGPNNGTAATDPLYLTPEEIEALETVLASQSQGQAKGKGEGAGAGVPGLSNA